MIAITHTHTHTHTPFATGEVSYNKAVLASVLVAKKRIVLESHQACTAPGLCFPLVSIEAASGTRHS